MAIDSVGLVIGAALVAALVMLAVALNEALRARARVRRRLAPLSDMVEGGDKPVDAPVREQVAEQNPFASLLDRRYPLAGGLRTAGLAALGGLVAAAALIPALAFVGVPKVLAVFAGVLLGGGVAWNLGAMLEERKRVQFRNGFLLVVEDFQRMVRFGISTRQALNSITASAEEPLKDSLRRVTLSADFGVPLGAALGTEARRVRITEMAMLAAIVSTQTRTGGGLAESVGNLAEMLRERVDNRSRIKAATSESKVTLAILSCVPFAGIGIQAALQPALVETLLDQARHLLGIGAGMIVAGLVVAWFMVRGVQK